MLPTSFHRGEAPSPPGRTAAPYRPASSANRLAPPCARRTGAAARYRYLRHDCAGRIGFRDHSSLGLVTPATPTPRPHPDIDPARFEPRPGKYSLEGGAVLA